MIFKSSLYPVGGSNSRPRDLELHAPLTEPARCPRNHFLLRIFSSKWRGRCFQASGGKKASSVWWKESWLPALGMPQLSTWVKMPTEQRDLNTLGPGSFLARRWGNGRPPPDPPSPLAPAGAVERRDWLRHCRPSPSDPASMGGTGQVACLWTGLPPWPGAGGAAENGQGVHCWRPRCHRCLSHQESKPCVLAAGLSHCPWAHPGPRGVTGHTAPLKGDRLCFKPPSQGGI